MAQRTLIVHPDPLLREVSEAVDDLDSVQELIDDLFHMTLLHQGVGLSAVQLGELVRVAVVNYPPHFYEVVNPKIVIQDPTTVEDREGCLSLPGLFAPTARPAAVEMSGLNRAGETIKLHASGWHARVLLHEVDHMDGRLIIDHLPRNQRMRLMREYRQK